MKKILTCLCAVMITLTLSAQDNKRSKVNLTVKDDKGVPIENATVQLMRSTDSALVKATITDGTGKAEIENVPHGSYILKVTIVNFITHYTSAFPVDQEVVESPSINLQRRSAEMKEVVVSAKKPFIQKLTDPICSHALIFLHPDIDYPRVTGCVILCGWIGYDVNAFNTVRREPSQHVDKVGTCHGSYFSINHDVGLEVFIISQ